MSNTIMLPDNSTRSVFLDPDEALIEAVNSDRRRLRRYLPWLAQVYPDLPDSTVIYYDVDDRGTARLVTIHGTYRVRGEPT